MKKKQKWRKKERKKERKRTEPEVEGERGDCWGAMTETIFREFLLLVFWMENDDADDENAERSTSFWGKNKK